jgi:two-component system OmpR family response regulator
VVIATDSFVDERSGGAAGRARRQDAAGFMYGSCRDHEKWMCGARLPTQFHTCAHNGALVRALVVEDDSRMADLLRRGLTESGYGVDVVRTGPDALWQAGEVDYDVILLDVALPGMDGFTVCQRLRSAQCWTPILMLTARADVADRVTGLDAGADDYLAKPFRFSELQARLRALLRRGTAPRPSVLVAGTLQLDPATRVARRGRTQLDLSAKEFELLRLFLNHPGDVLSRTYILEHVWDFAYQAGSNVVDQHVSALRRKVDRPFGVEQLETVRGAGYRLLPEARPAAEQ